LRCREHPRLEQRPAVLSCSLGLVKDEVSIPKQIVGRAALSERDADARRHRHRTSISLGQLIGPRAHTHQIDTEPGQAIRKNPCSRRGLPAAPATSGCSTVRLGRARRAAYSPGRGRCSARRAGRRSRGGAWAASATAVYEGVEPRRPGRRARRRGGSEAPGKAWKVSGTYVREPRFGLGRNRGVATILAAPGGPALTATTRCRASSVRARAPRP